MASSKRKIWKRASYSLFSTYFNKLNPYEQWIVNLQLDAMTYKKNPAAAYHSTICKDCGLDLHLFGIRNGIGNDILKMHVYLDYKRKIMHPLIVYPV